MNEDPRRIDQVEGRVFERHVKRGSLKPVDVMHVPLAQLDSVTLELDAAKLAKSHRLQTQKLVTDVGSDFQNPHVSWQIAQELLVHRSPTDAQTALVQCIKLVGREDIPVRVRLPKCTDPDLHLTRLAQHPSAWRWASSTLRRAASWASPSAAIIP